MKYWLYVCPGRLLGPEEEVVWILVHCRRPDITRWHFLFGVSLNLTLCEIPRVKPRDPLAAKHKVFWAHDSSQDWKTLGKEVSIPNKSNAPYSLSSKSYHSLQRNLKKLLQFFLFISSLSGWTLHFREHWQNIKLKKTGKLYHFSYMNPHHKDTVKNNQSLWIYWLVLDFYYIAKTELSVLATINLEINANK